MKAMEKIVIFFCLTMTGKVMSLLPKITLNQPILTQNFQSVGGQLWRNDFEGLECTILGPTTTFHSLGDDDNHSGNEYKDDYGINKQRKFNLNVGRALEVLRRELPMVFAVSNLDFSIFAQSITINDGKNSIGMTKPLYTAAVKSLRMASAISSMYPSMNVKKIDYIEESRTIQCNVDVVLPGRILYHVIHYIDILMYCVIYFTA